MNNVVCLKVGDKYNSDFVNKLYRACKRNLSIDYNFYCFTENKEGLDANIKVKDLPVAKYPFIRSWWWKTYLHKEGLFDEKDTNLYIDLDMVIVDNMDKFFTHDSSSRYIGCTLPIKKKGFANYIFRWKGNFDKVWDLIVLNPSLMETYRSDQEYVEDLLFETITFYPSEWVKSYKWEVRSSSDLLEYQPKLFIFKDIQDPKVPKDAAVFAFHGTPDLITVEDPVILKHWK
jgi:hypothetical protein